MERSQFYSFNVIMMLYYICVRSNAARNVLITHLETFLVALKLCQLYKNIFYAFIIYYLCMYYLFIIIIY